MKDRKETVLDLLWWEISYYMKHTQ